MKRAIIDGAHRLLEVAVLLEAILPNQDNSVSAEIQGIIQHLVEGYELELRSVYTQCRGRPSIDIYEEQLHYLLANGFKVTDIANMFGCSRRTIQRRMQTLCIGFHRFSSINDSDLDERVSEIVERLPSCGIRSVRSMLRADGTVVQR